MIKITGSENNGSVTAVNLTSGALGATGSTGSSPRRLAVKQAVVETPVVSYFLPRSVAVRLAGAGKDTLVASGFYDDGSLPVDYTKPVTVDIGLFSQAFTLAHKGANFTFKDTHTKFQITPNLKGSSQGKFKMKISKTTLMGLIDPTAPVDFHFRASGLPDAQGRVGLTAGKYRLGKKRGALFSPPAFPAKAKVKLGDGAVDSLTFKGGFATSGVTPAALGTVRFGLGPVFTRVIPGAQFKKTGDKYKFTAKQGKTSFTITLDFLRELVTVAAKGVELGTLSPATIDVVFDAGGSAGTVRTTVKVGVTGTTKRFY